MQDAIKELKELLEAAEEGKSTPVSGNCIFRSLTFESANNNKKDEDDVSDSDDGFDDFFGDEQLSEPERALVKELVRATSMCNGLVGNLARLLDISVELLEFNSGPWLEELAAQVNDLTAHVDEVIMTAQPPIAKSGMQQAVDEMISGINKIVETIKNSPLTSPASSEDIGNKSKKLVEVSVSTSVGLHKSINELLNALKNEDDWIFLPLKRRIIPTVW